jgi:hypothetical protein
MMKRNAKKVVMYLDGVRSIHKNVLQEALDNYITLDEMKQQLRERFHGHEVTFRVE